MSKFIVLENENDIFERKLTHLKLRLRIQKLKNKQNGFIKNKFYFKRYSHKSKNQNLSHITYFYHCRKGNTSSKCFATKVVVPNIRMAWVRKEDIPKSNNKSLKKIQ